MKARVLVACLSLAVLSGWCFSAEKPLSLEIGSYGYFTDVTSANTGFSLGADPYANLSYSLSLPAKMGLKFSLALDSNLTFATGNTMSASTANPQVAFTWDKLSVNAAFPVVYLASSANDLKGISSCLGNKALSYWASYYYKTKKITDPVLSYSSEKVAYAIALGKNFTLTPQMEADFIFGTGMGGLADLRPGLGISYGPISTTSKLWVISLPYTDTALGTSTYLGLDENVAFNLGTIGLKGFKASVSGFVPLTPGLKGVTVNPVLSWANYGFSVDANFRCTNVDRYKSSGDTVNAAFSPYLKASYTLKF